ncbi:unnamed protein product [Periconia digitata]|uniref:tRNA pseudouridine(55) synthase n=1 Tax=Periconia digitata TaxID=1303443 RepID=A0A9W4XPT3_9PLEO|nr:unnamed protein product [Periconia digitata]
MANLENPIQSKSVGSDAEGTHRLSSSISIESASASAEPSPILEGVFAISKPTTKTTPQILLDIQTIFATSTTFTPLLQLERRKRAEQEAHQPSGQKLKDEERDGRFFKLGHGGTLDPLASGVLIVGIGRGTKHLSSYLSSTKTYETVVLFGIATSTYDIQGEEVERKSAEHITAELVRRKISENFTGTFRQVPPVYSGLKVDGVKAVEYARLGKELPRDLVDREVCVDACEMLEFMPPNTHEFCYPAAKEGERTVVEAMPAARIRLTVSSGFYVRSFAHDLGVACGSVATMASLHRLRQGGFFTPDLFSTSSSLNEDDQQETVEAATAASNSTQFVPAIPYADITSSEETWAPQIRSALTTWMAQNPARDPNARGPGRKGRDKEVKRQRFRGEWLAETKRERVLQQGGKSKGKLSRKKNGNMEEGDK